ncbi:MAG: hypothetical protein ACO1G5_11665 [Bacteroidota bacterium]
MNLSDDNNIKNKTIRVNASWPLILISLVALAIFFFYILISDNFNFAVLIFFILLSQIFLYDFAYLELENRHLFVKNNWRLINRKISINLDDVAKLQFIPKNWRPNSTSKVIVFYKNGICKKYRFTESNIAEVRVLINELLHLNIQIDYSEKDWVKTGN